MLRKTLFIAAFSCAALVGCDDAPFGVQTASSARAQDRPAELRGICMSLALAPGTSAYRNCIEVEADRRQPETGYANHFNRPGMRYDQKGQLVDGGDYLIDRSGRRIGGKGYWITGARDDIVPPGTHVDSVGRALTATGGTPDKVVSIPKETVALSRADRRRSVTNCVGFADANGEQSTCAVTRQMSAREAQAQRRATEAQFQAQLRDSCGAYGLQVGAPSYNECLVREAHERRPTDEPTRR